jgi:hypothetical protein
MVTNVIALSIYTSLQLSHINVYTVITSLYCRLLQSALLINDTQHHSNTDQHSSPHHTIHQHLRTHVKRRSIVTYTALYSSAFDHTDQTQTVTCLQGMIKTREATMQSYCVIAEGRG